MKSWLVRVIPPTLFGLIIGPAVGMVLAENFAGSTDPMGARESGFEGFIHGLWVGPLVGFLLGFAWAARNAGSPGSDDES